MKSFSAEHAINPRLEQQVEPIAIIGLGCRFPGDANGPQAFWELLRDGVDAVREVPADRWSLFTFSDPDIASQGRITSRFGGFVDHIDEFDAEFFGISPREAARMDPQQRMLLEVAWEALEDGGQVPERLAGSSTGVFIGISTHDYSDLQLGLNDRRSIDAHTNTGGAQAIASNRISYCLDLRGPSLSIDTACSSSLVAVHQACASLRSGESSLALAGGVNALLKPEMSIGFSKAGMLASDGRCRAFDASGQGYVRAEGAGIVVLKRLSEALADGDRIYAVVLGSATNQDGRSHGMTVPSADAQKEMLRTAYRRAGVSPAQVQYVEAHGTGTPVGDPIEANAIGEVLGQASGRRAPCLIGSAKTNVGHLEAASGVVGLIKTALALHHRQIPASLHFRTPNPKIAFDTLGLRVASGLEPWPESDGPAIAGVNGFGFGGSNAHIVLSGAPAGANAISDGRSEERAYLVPLSARHPEALRALAVAYRNFFAQSDQAAGASLRDVAYTAAERRNQHEHRLALTVRSKVELIEGLDAFVNGEKRIGMSSGIARSANQLKSAGPVFIFSGMGPQFWNMGRELLATEPVFRAALERCDALWRKHCDWSLIDALMASETASHMEQTAVAQPTNFALQVALAEVWRAWGITPSAIVGHSAGEVAAAHVAGMLSLEDAVKVIFHRSRLQQLTAGEGAMAAVGLSLEETQAVLKGYEDRVSIAAINSPTSVTLSGDAEAIAEIVRTLSARQVFARMLAVQVPYHSCKMDRLQTELLQALADVHPKPCTIPIFSTVSGSLAHETAFDATYWWKNVREPVYFARAIEALFRDGAQVFLEVAPHPVLSRSILECLSKNKQAVSVLASLRKGEDDRTVMLGTLGALHGLGYPVSWREVNGGGGRLIRLPPYPWQRERHWHESEASRQDRVTSATHPLLGRVVSDTTPTWRTELSTRQLSYLNDHRVQGRVVFPAAGYIEMMAAAAYNLFGQTAFQLEEVEFHQPLFLSEEATTLQLRFDPQDSSFTIHSQDAADKGAWTAHVSGKGRKQTLEPRESESADEIRARCPDDVSRADCYAGLEQRGLQYGPCFQGLAQLWRGQGEALGEVQLAEELAQHVHDYQLHPALLDASFQAVIGAIGEGHSALLPVGIGELRFHGQAGSQVFSHVRLASQPNQGTGREILADIQLFDEFGVVCAEIFGFRLKPLDAEHIVSPRQLEDWIYHLDWERADIPPIESAAWLPAPAELCAYSQAQIVQLPAGQDRFYRQLGPCLDRLVQAYLVQAFSELGCELRPDARFTTSELAKNAGIGQTHSRLFERLLVILAEDGLLERSLDGWSVCRVPQVQNPESIRAALIADFPEAATELALIGRCGEHLSQVLRGDIDALTLLFPDQGPTAASLYRQSPGFSAYNLAVGAMIDKVVAACPSKKTLRILEIGAGTGGVTSHLLPRLAAQRTEYCFTDVSPHFFLPAKKEFAAYPFVRFQTLDIEADPVAQGFAPHSFDVVIAADVLHATRDLRATLVNAQRLLSANGLLILLEVTNPPRWADLVFGLTEGWWRFEDLALRPTSALISATRWSEILPQVGFGETAQFSEMSQAWHTLFVTRAPELSIVQKKAAASWLILADRMHVGEQIAARLESQGEAPILVFAGTQYQRLDARRFEIDVRRAQDLEQLIGVVHDELPALRGIVHLWSLDASSTANTTLASLEEANQLGCVSAMHLVQELGRKNWGTSPRLYLVTCGVHQIDSTDDTIAVAQSPLWGLGRVLMNEQPQLSATLVDIGPVPSSEEIEALFQEVWTSAQNPTSTNGEELALRASARFVHRLNKKTNDRGEGRQVLPGRDGFSLFATTPGVLDGLELRALARRTPGPGEVEIEIRAAGVNFKDVMKALGMLSDAVLDGGFSGHMLGMECAGRVVAVGEQVDNLEIGDEVIAMASGCMGGFVTAAAPLVVQKPPNLAFEDAAAIPVVFLTASYALIELGRLRRGERVLIHAAAGGVGLAAVQLAQQVGAEIFATAGNPEKREFLRKLGVHHVLDSRSLAFADEVMELTQGRGVDVVLNSLAGVALRQSLKLLSPYGRFLEIGKQDIDENTALGLRPFQNNLAFFAIDLDRLVHDRPEAMGTMLSDLVRRFHDGSLRPLPRTLFSIENAQEAFRHMAQAKHTGKVVLSMPAQPLRVSRPVQTTPIVHADGTYLVSGGLGGFGLAVAQWLAAKGARYVVLVGRRGVTNDEAERAIGRLKKAGVTVQIAQADVSREEDVTRVLDEIRLSMPPLRGIVHAAMVIDDALVSQLTEERFRKVMAPKVAGAWNLHLGTLSAPLDFFVMFSSVTALYGNPGQGNYAAANTFLDALAHHRHARGLPALAVDWGSLAEVGYVSRNADVGRFLERQGLKPFTPQQAFEILDHLLRRDSAQAGAMRLDWKALAKTNPTGVASARFAHLVSLDSDNEPGAEGAQRPTKTSRERLLTTEPAQRHALLQAHITEIVAGVLGTAPDRLDVERPLTKLGIDSLMAVELSIQIEVDVDLKLPTMSLLQGPSIVELTRLLLGMLAKEGAVSEPTAELIAEAPPQSPLVALQRAGSRVPFFCVHPVSGEVNCFLDLASHLPPEQPFYALQTVLHNGSNGHDIGEIAAQYLEAIRSVQPHGPYLLGGYSLGGVIAFEMAHQLRTLGERVELLTLIDSPSPVMNGEASSLDDATLVTWFAQELGVAAGRGLEVSPEELGALDPDAQLAFIWEHARSTQTMPVDTQLAFLRRKLNQFKANTRAFNSYRPQAYPDQVTFFQATEPLPGHFDSHEHTGTPGWGWARFVDKPLKLESVPGSHHTLLSSPHVKVLAQKLQACLEAAQPVH